MGSADSLAPKLSAVSPVLPDFLPLKCDACEQIFCTDHITYSEHRCTSAYKKDVQVPVCPLCSTPIPVKRGEMPDVAVGEHIDRDCRSDPAQRKRKIFTNKCLKAGCKQREMMKLICDQCHGNFCLKHRHPLDHNCSAAGPPLSKAGHAAVARVQTPSSMAAGTSSRPAAAPPAPVPGRAKTRLCGEPWSCPWQSRRMAQHSCSAVCRRRRRPWPWPRRCLQARRSTADGSSSRPTAGVRGRQTAACSRVEHQTPRLL
uniref:Zinc finger AN1-type containing 2B n=1 Tax=Pelusios castaneus TaxID=367368 RepID=A0A8C8SIC5_9SAUR